MKEVVGIAFTKATIFCYEIGLAYDFSAVSEHVKMFVNRWEYPYVINHMLRSEILEDYQARNSNILMRHLDLAIYALYTGRAQLFRKRNKSKVTPRMILEWIDLRGFGIGRFLKIIGNLDLIEQYSQEFTKFIDARL